MYFKGNNNWVKVIGNMCMCGLLSLSVNTWKEILLFIDFQMTILFDCYDILFYFFSQYIGALDEMVINLQKHPE